MNFDANFDDDANDGLCGCTNAKSNFPGIKKTI